METVTQKLFDISIFIKFQYVIFKAKRKCRVSNKLFKITQIAPNKLRWLELFSYIDTDICTYVHMCYLRIYKYYWYLCVTIFIVFPLNLQNFASIVLNWIKKITKHRQLPFFSFSWEYVYVYTCSNFGFIYMLNHIYFS